MNNYKKYDVVALGEAILDFVPSSDYIGGTYQASVGGAPFEMLLLVYRNLLNGWQ